MGAWLRRLRQKVQDGVFREMWREIKWIGRYMLVYRGAVALYLGIGILGTLMSLAGAVASKELIDVVVGHQTGRIAGAACLMIGLSLGSVAMRAGSSMISARVSVRVQNSIQADVYEKILNAQWEPLSEYRSGDLLNRLNGDVGTVAGTVIDFLPNLATRLVQFLGAFCIIFYYDRAMALIALASAPVTVLTSRLLFLRMRRYRTRMRELSSDLMSFEDDSFQNLQSIKAFGLTELFGSRLRREQERYRETYLEFNRFSALSSAFLSLVGIAVSMACYGWGVYRLWSGSISFGTMTLFLQLASSLSGAFSSLVGLAPTAISAATSAGRIMAVYGLPAEERPGGTEPPVSGPVSVRLRDAGFRYKDGDWVLRHGNMTLEAGKITALVGSSGAGKTTLIRILLGLVNVTEGEAALESPAGERRLSAASRSAFAYVPQGNTLFAGTIGENLRLVRQDAPDEALWQALHVACADEFVRRLPRGLDSPVGERGKGLSEGQAQRIAIARAVLRDAPVLILDEATSALDRETERTVLSRLADHGVGRTCLVTSHRESVLHLAHRVYRVEGAALQPDITPEDAGA